MLNPIVYAIPVFFALIALEIHVARRRGVAAYHAGDAVASIGLGAVSQVSGIFSKLIFLGIYVLVYEHLRVATLPQDSVLVWLGALLAYDFCYYWYHRMSHEVAVLWAAHVVHHQSEAFNLSTALRQTSTGFLLGWIFYLPLAIAGVPPLVFVAVGLIDLLYQYWIHTELVGKLGWFDRVFASPSNHRVHHGVNDRYLDKNYGGILILWDRMFGTFEDEHDEERVVYGTRAPLRSFDPLWANVEVYSALARDAWHARSFGDKVRVFLKPPGWRPADVAERFPKPAFDLGAFERYVPEVPRATRLYALVQFALMMLPATYFLAVADTLAPRALVAFALWICASVWALCALLQGRRGAWLAEIARLVVGAALLVVGAGLLV
jgi:sterol desaturase/sphingolipid hydroxylase (fatty acid hydroxylase superfamily)